jgi:hypothetical protein
MTIAPNIKEVKRAIVGQAHNGPTVGHPGRDEALRKVQQHFWWLGMKTWIMEYIRGCTTCQHVTARLATGLENRRDVRRTEGRGCIEPQDEAKGK